MQFGTVERLALAACSSLVVGLLLTGCTSTRPKSAALSDFQNTVTVGVDTHDLMAAAEAAVASLLGAGIFDRAPHHPAMLAISRFRNDTSQQFDMGLLTGQIGATLLKTGKVVLAGMDPKFTEPPPPVDGLARPDFTLSGSVVETIEHRRSIKQSTYVFQFALADSNGLVVWEECKTITKTTRRNAAL